MRGPRLHLPGGLRQWVAPLAVLVVAAPLGWAAVSGTGYPPAQVTLAGGTAWLTSPAQGLVTLVDGPSDLVVGSVRAPVRDTTDVVQVGSSALLVDEAAGSVRRLDGGTYDVSPPVRFADGGGLRVLAGRTAAYVVDTVRRTASAVDPTTLRAGAEAPLGATPGPGQAVVDDAQRLWVVDATTGGLAGVGPAGGSPVRSSATSPAARLAVVQGRPVVVDPARRSAGFVGSDAQVGKWSCFAAPASAGMQLLGSDTAPRLYAAVPETGTLLTADLAAGTCPAPVAVGAPGDKFGPLVESNGFVLVPDETTGKLAVVDVGAGAVRSDLDVLPGAAGQLQLVARDGLVFYNDLVGERAGVLRFDGQWSVGPPGEKYRVRADAQPDVALLASGEGDVPTGFTPAAPPPRGRLNAGPARPVSVAPPPPPPPTVAPTESVTETTPPPQLVTLPDFSTQVGVAYPDGLFYIRDQIAEVCGNHEQCLTPVAVPPAATSAAGSDQCLILSVPKAGTTVPRDSTIRFPVDRPCSTTTTATTTSPPETTEPPVKITHPIIVVTPPPTLTTTTTTTKKKKAPVTEAPLPDTGGATDANGGN